MHETPLDSETLSGQNALFQKTVDDLRKEYGFDFATIGLAAFRGSPLKWLYGTGNQGNNYRRIALAPGRGIGGIVLKTGKPMMCVDIDTQIDPREYSSYPIVFAEGLRSFCAVPLSHENTIVGALLMAYRTLDTSHEQTFLRCLEALQGTLCGLELIDTDFLDFSELTYRDAEMQYESLHSQSDMSNIILAQEKERHRISRELHDALAQELLMVSMNISVATREPLSDTQQEQLEQASHSIDAVLDQIHNLSVELRPSTLDYLGLLPALRSQAAVFEQRFGTQTFFSGTYEGERFDSVIETQAFRIAQEAMKNACKYSGTERIDVTLDQADGWLRVSVKDEGGGFNVSNPTIRGTGCGLAGIKERALLIGVDIDISSSAEGTTITLVAPMSIAANKQKEK